LRAIQLQLLAPLCSPVGATPLEPKGVVYTKRWVVDLLLDLAGYLPENNLVDAVAVEPSAGAGAFLGPIVERLTASCQKLGRPLSDCRDSLIAFELDAASAERAKELVIGELTDRGLSHPLAEAMAARWVRNEDYLFEAPGIEADFVIGNPPYVRLEEIPESTAATYRNAYPAMTGRADLYIAFFEAALHQLKEDGVCAFICADRWMRNQYGAGLRKLIASGYGVETVIEMHQADAFHEEVDAYPAITVIRRRRQGPAIVASAGPEVEEAPSQVVSDVLRATARGERPVLPQPAFERRW
jgi:adenine-specific DNA-methyltransferase